MVPQTAATLVVFALLIVPGITFELLRQTRRPAFDQTALEEVSRVVLASMSLVIVAAGVLGLLSLISPGLIVDIGALAHHGSGWYWRHHPAATIITVLSEVMVATALAFALHRSLNQPNGTGWATRVVRRVRLSLGHRPGEQLERFSVWRTLLRDWKPPDADTKVTVLKKDGTLITGIVAGYEATATSSERDIALGQPLELYRPGWDSPRKPDAGWRFLVVPGDQISEVFITWPPRAQPEPVAAEGPH